MATPQSRSTTHKKSSPPQAKSEAPDAVTLLKHDHAEVKKLFKSFEDADDDEKQSIATQVCKLLTVHATIEEEILYPAAKDAFKSEEDEDMVNEAEIEHGSAKALIAQIEKMDSDDEKFNATVKVLSEQIEHHVKEEESEFFPKVKKTKIDLDVMGQELFDRKQELMADMGIVDDADE